MGVSTGLKEVLRAREGEGRAKEAGGRGGSRSAALSPSPLARAAQDYSYGMQNSLLTTASLSHHCPSISTASPSSPSSPSLSPVSAINRASKAAATV
jgi:hypothetical protein